MTVKNEASWSLTILIPCYNEAGTIEGLLDSLRNQTVTHSLFETLIVDGGSIDGTQQLVTKYADKHPELEVDVIENPDRIIPAALNRGVRAAKGDVIIRLDAHSAPAPDYIEKCLETLKRTNAANVGGQWRIKPGAKGSQAKAIASAAAHPLGAGDARYRISGQEGPVETVPFGAFRREWLERVGPFNEELLTNEDYEYNLRIRQAGGVVWFNPDIEATYYARASFFELAKQYWRYGYWKAQMLKRFPESLRWRQGLPPLFVLAALLLLLISPFTNLAGWLLALQWGSYATILFLAGILQAVRKGTFSLVIGFPIAIAIMHLAWGSAFIYGSVTSPQEGHNGA